MSDNIVSDYEFQQLAIEFWDGFQPKQKRRVWTVGDKSGNKTVSGNPALTWMQDESGNLVRVKTGSLNQNTLPAGAPVWVGDTVGYSSNYPEMHQVATEQISGYNGQAYGTAYIGIKYVAFGDSVGNIKGSANFQFDDTNGEIDIYSNTGAVFQFWSYSQRGAFTGNHANGTQALPTHTLSGDEMMRVSAFGRGTTIFSPNSVARMQIFATENFSDTATGAKLQFQTTPNTTNTPTTALTLDQDQRMKPAAGIAYERTTVADAPYAALAKDYYIGYTSLSVARTVTLPSATSIGAGSTYTIQDEVGGAGTNNIIIATTGGDTIDGGASGSASLTSNYGSITLYSNGGTDWKILSQIGATSAAPSAGGTPVADAQNILATQIFGF